MRSRPRAINQEARPRQSGPSLALGTLTRADFFRGELEQFLLMARENSVSPLEINGSYAGAIGSVARYLNMHGWQAKAPVAVQGDPLALIAAGIKPAQPLEELLQQGVSLLNNTQRLAETAGSQPAALIDLVTPAQPTEYWVGFDNFYVITRYNRSSFYAMSVFQLAEALREAQSVRTN